MLHTNDSRKSTNHKEIYTVSESDPVSISDALKRCFINFQLLKNNPWTTLQKMSSSSAVLRRQIHGTLVEPRRVELLTFCVQNRCSPN